VNEDAVAHWKLSRQKQAKTQSDNHEIANVFNFKQNFIVITEKGGKQWQPTPKNLYRM
jgi:hypothetical protein